MEQFNMEHLIAVGAHVGAVLAEHKISVDIEDLAKAVKVIYEEVTLDREDISFMERLNKLGLFSITQTFKEINADIEDKFETVRMDLDVRGERYATLHVYRENDMTELNEVVNMGIYDNLEPITVIADYAMTDKEVAKYIEENRGEILFEMGVALT